MWNYRVVRRAYTSPGGNGVVYGIYEAYYDDDGQINGLTENPQHVFGESLEELKRDHELMTQAFNLPVVDYETLKDIKD